MDINSVVELVNLATTENARKQEATQVLDQIRTSPDRWSLGLRLFLESSHEMSRFFGLSLVRDWMQCELSSTAVSVQAETTRREIRGTLMKWFSDLLTAMSNNTGTVPFFLLSNAISVVTLCIKFDFPLHWPTAFSELLQLGYAHGIHGIEVVVKVLKELEVEIVMFSETRSKAEMALNTAVKDAMRDSSVMLEIVMFLCRSAQHALETQRFDLCAACLRSLAELIAWIDVTLVMEQALPTVFTLWQCQDSTIRAASCLCFFELVKKGMDPVAKVRLLHTVGLVGLLVQDQRTQTLLGNTSVGSAGKKQGKGLQEEEERELEQAGALVDMIVLELFGCWSKYEDMVCGGGKGKGSGASPSSSCMSSGSNTPVGSSNDSSELVAAVPLVVGFLHQLLPLLLQFFVHPVLKVSNSTLPSCARLVMILRTQQQRAAQLQTMQTGEGGAATVFRAEDFLNPLLSAVYSRSQYPADFDFDAAQEDELDEETEAKSEVRKLFVNCCRVRPDRCLELLCAVLSSQPLPLSSAPYPPLEAALRLVHAFSECGPGHNKLLSEGSFPALVRALHESDVCMHRHPQVVLVYFEISQRYIRYLDKTAVQRLFQAMLSNQGVRSAHTFLRSRAAYFLLKVAETQEGKNANALESIYPQLSGILTETASIELSSGFTRRSPVSEQSELYLCETVALLTASLSAGSEADAVRGSELLRGIIEVELGQLHLALCLSNQQPQLMEALCAVATRRLAALAGLTKGYSCKNNTAAVPVFEAAASAVVSVTQRLAFQRGVRSKVMIFLHRMVACIGSRVLGYQEQILPVLLAHADSSDADEVVQVLNQLMVEYLHECLPLVQTLFGVVVDKYSALSSALESVSVLPGQEGSAIEAPHVHAERLALHRQYLLFVQHVVTCGCAAALFTPEHLPRLEGILFSVVLPALAGGAVSSDAGKEVSSQALRVNPNHIGNSDTQDSVPVRKGGLVILNGLVTSWLLPPTLSSAPAGSAVPTPPPAEVANAFRSYLLDQALPRAIHSISAWCAPATGSGCAVKSQLNVKDAAAQGVLIELAVLLRNTHSVLSFDPASQSVSNIPASSAYFTSMLQSVGWPGHKVQIFLQQLTAQTPLGTYKETFKLFIRECSA